MAASGDPYYIVQEETNGTMQEVQEKFARWKVLPPGSAERKALLVEQEEELHSLEYILQEIDRSTDAAETQPDRFRLTQAEISQRRSWAESKRRQVRQIRDALRNPGGANAGAGAGSSPAAKLAAAAHSENEYFLQSEGQRQQAALLQQDNDLDALGNHVIRIDPRRSVSVSQGTLALLLLGGVAIGGTLEHLSLAQQAVGLGVSGSLSPQPHPTRPSTNDSSFAQQDSSYARYTQHLQARQEGSPTGESLSWLSVWRWLRNQPSSQALGGAPPPQAALSPYFIAEAASRAAPGVVNILVSAPREETDIGEGASFPSAAGPGSSSGSGFLCHPDGTILTNAHVVADALPRVKGARPNFEGLAARLGPSPSAPKAVSGRLFGRASLAPAPAEQSFAQHSSLLVTLSDGRMFEGRVEHWDLVSDLAIVKIEADTPLPHIPLGRSSQLCAGQWVVALGSPLHLQNSVTAGIVSCTDRKALDLGLPGAWTEYIQTDTAINRGNSGGPLVNLEGQVVGISAMKALAADGVSFAIPIDAALDVARQLRDRGRVLRPYAGMRMLQLNPHNAAQFRKKDDAFPDVSAGILVPNVREDSPAQKAGIRAGDVIVGFQGASAQPTTRELVASLGKHIGKPLALTVVRGRERHTVSLVALEAPLMR